jgi:hypothetical protein
MDAAALECWVMGLGAAARFAAQSFDRIAAGFDRLGDLSDNDGIRSWLVRVLPPAGGRALDPARRILHRLVPLRPRLHAGAVLSFRANLARLGPATAWEIYRLSTRREWLDHRVSDQFSSREELDQCCATLFPGCQLEPLGGTVIGLTWDSTL